jgi:hypothetical protein
MELFKEEVKQKNVIILTNTRGVFAEPFSCDSFYDRSLKYNDHSFNEVVTDGQFRVLYKGEVGDYNLYVVEGGTNVLKGENTIETSLDELNKKKQDNASLEVQNQLKEQPKKSDKPQPSVSSAKPKSQPNVFARQEDARSKYLKKIKIARELPPSKTIKKRHKI